MRDARQRQREELDQEAAWYRLVPLQWSVQAMQRAFERIREIGWDDPVGMFAAVGETLWWIQVVGGHLREQHKDAYEEALDREPNWQRLFAGLRFARNRIAHGVDMVQYLDPAPLDSVSHRARWTWRPLPARPDHHNHGHLEYQAVVAGHDVVETLMLASMLVAQVSNAVSRSA